MDVKATTHRLCLVLILVYAATWRVATLDRPFAYDDESTGAAYGMFARNYLAFGVANTRALPVLTVGEPPPDTPLTYYRDHPPLVPLIIALTYLTFGVGEWQTRLLSAVASVCAVWVLHRLVKRESSDTPALIAAAIYAATPMNLYFGGMPEVLGAPLVLFSLLAVDAYLSLHERGTPRRLMGLIVTLTAAALCDWPAFILVPVLVIHFLATRPRDAWPWICAFSTAVLAVFAALYVYIALAARLPWNWMVPLFLHRSAIGSASFSATQWWSTAVTFNRHLHTLPVLVLSGAWLLTTARSRVGRILLAWGILHVAIGRQGVFNHEWWWWPLTPGLAVTAALFLESLIPSRVRFAGPGLPVHASVAAPGLRVLVVLALVAFAIWTSVSTFKELFPDRTGERFTTRELGEAIRAAAPTRSDLALLVWSGFDPQIWFYGDRAVRTNIWSVADLERRLHEQTADLMFGFQQPWTGPPAGVVFPVYFREEMQELRDFLHRRYRRMPLASPLGEKFDVYDLRSDSIR